MSLCGRSQGLGIALAAAVCFVSPVGGYVARAASSGGGAVDSTGGGDTPKFTVRVNAGTLSGNGTVGGHVIVAPGGTLAPGAGAGSDTGTLTVNGNVTMADNSVLLVGLGAGTNCSRLVATGTVTVAGTLTGAQVGSAVGGRYTIIQAGSVTGAFTNRSVALGGSKLPIAYSDTSVNLMRPGGTLFIAQ